MKEKITKREEDFSKWYHDIIKVADLAEHSDVKGAMIIKPHGYAIWENIKDVLNKKIKDTGAQNVYFPMFIPESYLSKEKDHIEGFSPELAVVTHAGGKKLDEPLVVRPTSETIINNAFSGWIDSWRDLPLMINQWANVVRWELRPRLFLRTTEFLWQEGHTAHKSEEDAEKETLYILENVYKKFVEEYMAIPVITGLKSESEKFAGALRTYTIEGMMQDGKALQMGTSHNLGQNFAKVFDIKYKDEDNNEKYTWQTSWGVSTRLIGGLIMSHSDDKGLVLPPKISPIDAVIVPIWKEDKDKDFILEETFKIKDKLSDFKILIDDRENESVGAKFYKWEKKGVPVRIEVGIREIENKAFVFVRRDNGEKIEVLFDDISKKLNQVLEDIQKNLFKKLKDFRDQNSFEVSDYSELKELVKKGFVYADWCGSKTCEEEIKYDTKATIRCIPLNGSKPKSNKCIKCGNEAKYRVIFAKSY
jgi:prolyl-tRNA synthetase